MRDLEQTSSERQDTKLTTTSTEEEANQAVTTQSTCAELREAVTQTKHLVERFVGKNLRTMEYRFEELDALVKENYFSKSEEGAECRKLQRGDSRCSNRRGNCLNDVQGFHYRNSGLDDKTGQRVYSQFRVSKTRRSENIYGSCYFSPNIKLDEFLSYLAA